jgi:hypothetical protein
MHTNVPGAPAVRAAFAALIDYAGLYPPAQLPMADSVAEYIAAAAGSHAWMLGRFIVPVSRLDELLKMVKGEPPALSVIVDAGLDPRTWLPNVQSALAQIAHVRATETRVRVEALEIALAPLQTNRETYDAAIGQFAAAAGKAALRDVPAFVELPRDSRREALLPGAMYALARHRLGGKVRCGGVTAQATPQPIEIAAFIAHATEENVAYKATAGLHHPIRRFNEEAGFVMHGFLNVLVASLRARRGANVEQLEAVIANGKPTGLQLDEDAGEIEAMRRESFIAYGSCSFSEPIEDLQNLGLI